MRNKVLRFLRQEQMMRPGDRVFCAVSGGGDSMALLWCLWELRDKLEISVEAAHFNHHLRGEESDRDAAFVRQFCEGYQIPLTMGEGFVQAGPKGLEAAAREARYSFFGKLDGLVATAHTADDNAETILLHLVRGTGLKGLGGIAPVRGRVIRPMLLVTHQEALDYLANWGVPHVHDSTNDEDVFLRNRLRHQVMPLLKQENPKLVQNLSAMALRLRQDDAALDALSEPKAPLEVKWLQQQAPAVRSRILAAFFKQNGVPEPEACHIAQAEALVMTKRPSAYARFPGGVTLVRRYDVLEVGEPEAILCQQQLHCPGTVCLPESGLVVRCMSGWLEHAGPYAFSVLAKGDLVVRSRRPGDSLRLPGGTKSLKKLLIDRKIPAGQRQLLPVVADQVGVLGVYAIGPNLDRISGTGFPVTISFESIHSDDLPDRENNGGVCYAEGC